jgi:alpha-L-rhamnosidase
MWGRFNVREALAVGRPCLVAKLEIRYEDGTADTVVSDTSWKVADGPLLRNSLYLGEVYDARRETPGWQQAGFDDAAWRPAVGVDGPGGALQPRGATVRACELASRRQHAVPAHVVDLGRTLPGNRRLVRGQRGRRGDVPPRELLHPTALPMTTGVCGQIKRAGMVGRT